MFDLFQHTHLLAVAGSRAYGLHSPSSDLDLKGMAIPPASHFHGFLRDFQQADSAEEMAVFQRALNADEALVVAGSKLEGSVYGIRKVARLAIDCNPHMLDLLFCRESELRIATPLGRRVRQGASGFLSRRARHSFGGYATAQLKRIQTHRRWLLEPETPQPERKDFGLPANMAIPREQVNAAMAAIRKVVDGWELDLTGVPRSTVVDVQNRIAEVLAQIGTASEVRWKAAARTVGLDDNFVDLMDRERRYRRAKQQFSQRESWKKNRNPARAELEARYGYDTKHGAHLVRLLRMAVELVETGLVHVWRGDRDADELLAIRAGEWSYEALLEWVEQTDRRLDAALPGSVLPPRPDREALDALVISAVEDALRAGEKE